MYAFAFLAWVYAYVFGVRKTSRKRTVKKRPKTSVTWKLTITKLRTRVYFMILEGRRKSKVSMNYKKEENN